MPAAEEHAPAPCHPPGVWVTIGSFDGVHLGHQAIIRKLVEDSHAQSSACVVVTFFPHPAKALRQLPGPYYLSTPEEKDEILASLGVDSLLTLHFDRVTAAMSAEAFIRMLHDQLKFTCLLIGHDFRLGANRSGDFESLSRLGQQIGYCVHAIQPVQKSSQPVSSSRIRELLLSGDVHNVRALLGKPYAIQGTIVHGDGRGKHIGLPTANLQVWSEKLLPESGVYAARALIAGKQLNGVVNIGRRPTFYTQPVQQTTEVHLLDFSAGIYGQEMRLFFIERIRHEKKFDSAQDLMVQIHQDIHFAREVLSHEPEPKHIPA